MTDYIDLRLRQWLENLAERHEKPLGKVVPEITDKEINNRIEPYPRMQAALGVRPINILEVAAAARCCTLMAGQFPMMNFERFIKNEKMARAPITRLLSLLGQPNPKVEEAIDDFIQQAVDAGYRTADNQEDRSGTARFASLILTTVYPNSFVDYPSTESWRSFGEYLGRILEPSEFYGNRLVWASALAKEITQTPTFEKYWPDSPYPLWIAAGLNWTYKREH